MGKKTLLSVDAGGRITLPSDLRRALQLEPGARVECEVVDNTVLLRKAEDLPREDSWLSTPASGMRLEEAAQRARSGRRWQATEQFFVRLAAEAKAAHAAGRELSRETLADLLAAAERTGDVEQVGAPRSPATADK